MNQNVLPMQDRDGFPPGFWQWLNDNETLYLHFKAQAIRMALTGRTRYSARTIIEVLRWETELRDSDIQFKINNNMVPGMARLFVAECGRQFPGFFQLRDSLGRDE